MVTYVNKVTSWNYPYMEYHGLSTDTKPTGAPVNSMFIELDTGDEYYFSDGEWCLMGGSVADGSIQLSALNVTQNGKYNAGSGQAYHVVNVNVPNPSTGTVSITENGTVDVTNYASAEVNVPSSSNSDFATCIERDSSITKIPNNVTKIGDYAFYYYNNLGVTSLPNGIGSIGTSAFQYCTNLALTTLPSSITDIANYAFYNCTKLESLTFEGTPTSIKSNSFERCKNLVDIYVPWAHGEVDNAPWGATNATIHYNWVGA